jgi:hypothetical protein
VVLAYDPAKQKYVGASPRFAAAFDAEIAELAASTQPGGICEIYSLIVTLLYTGRYDDAKSAFDRLYTGANAEADWNRLRASVAAGRNYVPTGNEPALPVGDLYQDIPLGDYHVRLWHPWPGQPPYDFATISKPGQPDVRVDRLEEVVALPAADVTGEGNPDVVFQVKTDGGNHCCWARVGYNLGASTVKMLEVVTPWYMDRKIGEFKDLDADGNYEYVTLDTLSVTVFGSKLTSVLKYDAAQGKYAGASPRFASYYDAELAELTASTQPGDVYSIFRLPATLVYIGREADAKAAFDRLYTGTNAAEDWAMLVRMVKAGTFYVAP